MEHFISRQRLLAAIQSRLRASPVTLLLGARQVGKTMLARMIAAGRGEVRVFDDESYVPEYTPCWG